MKKKFLTLAGGKKFIWTFNIYPLLTLVKPYFTSVVLPDDQSTLVNWTLNWRISNPIKSSSFCLDISFTILGNSLFGHYYIWGLPNCTNEYKFQITKLKKDLEKGTKKTSCCFWQFYLWPILVCYLNFTRLFNPHKRA